MSWRHMATFLMNLLPWQSFQLQCELDRDEVLRLLEHSTPTCLRRPDLIGDVPFFCGRVDVESGSFRFERNTWPRSRWMCPQLRGRVRTVKRGSIVEANVSPSAGFWLGLSPTFLMLACIPIGLLAWLFGSPEQPGSPLIFVLAPLFGVMFLWWMWGPLLFLTYSNLSRYHEELADLLDQMTERTPDGLSVLEAEETPEQAATKKRLRREAGQNAMKLIAVFLVLMGLTSAGVGAKGWSTEQLTLHVHSKSPRRPNESRSVTLIGPPAVTTAKGMVSGGLGVILTGGVCWLVSRHDPLRLSRNNPSRQSWPPLETALLLASVVLIVLGAVLGIKGLF